jgi:hypothetical protein
VHLTSAQSAKRIYSVKLCGHSVKLGVLMDYLLAARLIALPRSAQTPDMLTSPASDRDIRTGIVCGQVVTSKR